MEILTQALNQSVTLAAILIPIILGVVEAVKRMGVPSKYSAAVAVVVGVGVSILLSGVTTVSIFVGVLLGLSASGLWSGTKATFKKS